ncbi:MAG: HEAT repeat domain-containing protein [Planctomycetota bacterium]|nr:HEAT repeat domain-containing protein [Planctomycetota bacterium]
MSASERDRTWLLLAALEMDMMESNDIPGLLASHLAQKPGDCPHDYILKMLSGDYVAQNRAAILVRNLAVREVDRNILAETYVPSLLNVVRSQSEYHAWWYSVSALGQLRAQEATDLLSQQLLERQGEHHRLPIIEAMGQIRSPAFEIPLLRVAETDQVSGTAYRATEVLGQLHSRKAFRLLMDRASSGDTKQRVKYLGLLEAYGDKSAVPVLRTASASNVLSERIRGIEALGNLGGSVDSRYVVGLYTHATEATKIALLNSISKLDVHAASPVFAQILQDCVEHQERPDDALHAITAHVLEELLTTSSRPEAPPLGSSPDAADRDAIIGVIRKSALHKVGTFEYPIPGPDQTGWINEFERCAWVELTDGSSGVGYLFFKNSQGSWVLLAKIGHWMN